MERDWEHCTIRATSGIHIDGKMQTTLRLPRQRVRFTDLGCEIPEVSGREIAYRGQAVSGGGAP